MPHYRLLREECAALLQAAVLQNIVRIEGRLYRQHLGIPQVWLWCVHMHVHVRTSVCVRAGNGVASSGRSVVERRS